MKKIVIGLLLALTSSAQAENSWNVKISPLHYLIGAVEAEVDYSITSNISVGLGGLSYSQDLGNSTLSSSTYKSEISVTEFKVRGDYWFEGTFKQGWYVGGSVSQMAATAKNTYTSGEVYKGTLNVNVLKAIGGYHWQWDSFNMALGGGVVQYMGDSKVKLSSNIGVEREETIPMSGGVALEYTLGWAF